ncbi:hypothetical protein [Lapillicoccus jejuensis]|uniref:Uncharacterized protein n=1 Tax=Lapillicoccus jejuensis TaxID=402171 RepID=A0A542DX11_9MICO|nr:hypothetical protein [Lapillicoccus jejuensis]TQJ07618.1 hypothetical protein FB458_0686 [Lapillicoccus jejuensis]
MTTTGASVPDVVVAQNVVPNRSEADIPGSPGPIRGPLTRRATGDPSRGEKVTAHHSHVAVCARR